MHLGPSGAAAPCTSTSKQTTRCVAGSSAGQGFGSGKAGSVPRKGGGPKKGRGDVQGVDVGSSKAVKKALRLAEGNAAGPINPKKAAQGKVDYVEVKDWGSGRADELGDLRVVQHSVLGTAAGSARQMPFYEQLARHLEMLKAQGALNVAQPAGAPPLPPFERWSFRRERYIEYCMDNNAVHIAVENAVEQCATCAGDWASDTDIACVAGAAALLGESSGLGRSLEVVRDLSAIARASPMGEAFELVPTQQATSYADYISQLGSRCSDAEVAMADRVQAGAAVISNLYAVYITHLTTGMRVGAAAAERLDLVAIRALNFYQTYPAHVDDPLQVFIEAINEVGQRLQPAQREAVMDELPRAFQRTALLLATLAHEN